MRRCHARYEKEPVKCKGCGHYPCGWFQNIKGKWYLVELFPIKNLKGLYYTTGMGAYGNWTPWHVCRKENGSEI